MNHSGIWWLKISLRKIIHTTSKGAYSDIFITKTDKADVQLTTILIKLTGKWLQIAFTKLMHAHEEHLWRCHITWLSLTITDVYVNHLCCESCVCLDKLLFTLLLCFLSLVAYISCHSMHFFKQHYVAT